MSLDARVVAVQGAGSAPGVFAVLGLRSAAPIRDCLNPRAIAIQGVGFGAGFLARQGLLCDAEEPVDEIDWSLYVPRPVRKRRNRDDDVLLFLL